MAIGTYSFLVFITQRLLWPLTTLGHVLDEYQRSMASTKRILDLIDTKFTINDSKTATELNNYNQDIHFENIGKFHILSNCNEGQIKKNHTNK